MSHKAMNHSFPKHTCLHVNTGEEKVSQYMLISILVSFCTFVKVAIQKQIYIFSTLIN